MLPDVEIRKKDYVFRKLDDFDKRGPFLGLYTDCCQHLHNAGEPCAKAGWKQSESGFYVVEKNGEIVAQSWAWRGKKDELVFDSIEGLGNVNVEVIAQLYLEAAKKLKGRLCITDINIGNTTYGLTLAIIRNLEKAGYIESNNLPAKMIRKVNYLDAEMQVRIKV